MPAIRVTIHLPSLLVLPPGEYPTPAEGGSVRLAEIAVARADGTVEVRTEVSALFDGPDGVDTQEQQRQRRAEADRLLRRLNHLLRWYRVVTGHATIIELTRAQASPFRFAVEGTGAVWGSNAPLEYESPALRLPPGGGRASFGDAVCKGLYGKTDPDVATLNLLDAEYALSVGRFREAVLLCWGAIDSTFVRKFKSLVDARLGDEWSEGRDFLKGIDFGLRHKMTNGWRLLTGRSLYAEPNNFWQELSASYGLRNKIIHEGQIAHEDDAKLAIKVTRKIVLIVASLSDNPKR
jgi:hypothetical protein